MSVSPPRRFRAVVAAVAMTTTVGIGTSVANAEPAAHETPTRFDDAGDLLRVLDPHALAAERSAEAGTSPAADPATSPESENVAAEPAAGPAPAPPPAPLGVTPEELARIVPGIPSAKIEQFIGPLNDAMAQHGIDTPVRQAAFIAQLAVESDSFRTFEEYASGRAYEGRSDLGNTQPGDGERYKGRGAIQITGRHNYEKLSRDTGVDFVAHPEWLAAPENAFTTAAWYWTTRNLNQVADTAGIVRVSELVNGGHHALSRRIDDFRRGLDVLLQP